jgi:CBS domain-containing protein
VFYLERKLTMKTELVYRWMSREPITVSPDASLEEAVSLLREYDIRRLPVVDAQDNLVGIVTWGDIREASASDATSLNVWELNYLLSQLTIKRIMTPSLVTAYTTDTIAEAARLMLENKISGLPVVDPIDGGLIGVITESDIFRLVVQTWAEPEIDEVEFVRAKEARC